MLSAEQQTLPELELDSGSGTGDTAADAGQEEQSLETEAPAEAPVEKLSWQEILADPEYKSQYDAQVQAIIQKRLRSRGDAEQRLQRLAPVLSALGERFGALDSADMEQLARDILSGDSGSTRQSRVRQAEDHLARLVEQEAELRASFPDFDLLTAMEDPAFVRLTAPHTGLSLADAYYALHRREIGEATARSSLEAAAKAVRSGMSRPRELSGNQAASTAISDPRNMSREQREALKQRIYQAKAQGKKLPYGG